MMMNTYGGRILDDDTNQWYDEQVARAAEEAACEKTVAAGRCTLCERDASELVPWSGDKLCWDCVDLNMDLMAAAVKSVLPLELGIQQVTINLAGAAA